MSVMSELDGWLQESIELVGREETIALLHDAYLLSAPDASIVAALATLGDYTFAN